MHCHRRSTNKTKQMTINAHSHFNLRKYFRKHIKQALMHRNYSYKILTYCVAIRTPPAYAHSWPLQATIRLPSNRGHINRQGYPIIAGSLKSKPKPGKPDFYLPNALKSAGLKSSSSFVEQDSPVTYQFGDGTPLPTPLTPHNFRPRLSAGIDF